MMEGEPMKTESYYERLLKCQGLKIQLDELKSIRQEWVDFDTREVA